MSKSRKAPYFNHELSWLEFNSRVLSEAMDKKWPLLDRMNFLSITAANLDEFFMVRVSGLKAQIDSGYKLKDPSGLTPQEQLRLVSARVREFTAQQYECLSGELLPALKRQGIAFKRIDMLSIAQSHFISEYYDDFVFPLLTPMAVDGSRPFPSLLNMSLYIAARLKLGGEKHLALVQVPTGLPRLTELPASGYRCFLLLEDIVLSRLESLFESCEVESTCLFRITRNSDLYIDDGAHDLLFEISESLEQRKRGRPVRLEVSPGADGELLELLIGKLHVGRKDVYEAGRPLDLTAFFQLSQQSAAQPLRAARQKPLPAVDFSGATDSFSRIREHDCLVHHPYESFDSVVDLLNAAADDEHVLAIKQTLYRIGRDSPVASALKRAAKRGKQVTALIELKARFDEESNIHWASELEQAGCHVVYGLSGLKTHCKLLLIIRREQDGIRRYVHVATGNYNASTARQYTDIGLFTCSESYGRDASHLFNVLTGYSQAIEYDKFVVAPRGLRSFLEGCIDREIENTRQGRRSGITMKVNSLVDRRMVDKLYEASGEGVPVSLIVRGACSLVPGVVRLSEHIRVVSIVGRYLEHSRIFAFESAGNKDVYIASADLMSRNFGRRVELAVPIEDIRLKRRIHDFLNIMLSDTENARKLLADGSYQRLTVESDKVDSQQALREYLASLQPGDFSGDDVRTTVQDQYYDYL